MNDCEKKQALVRWMMAFGRRVAKFSLRYCNLQRLLLPCGRSLILNASDHNAGSNMVFNEDILALNDTYQNRLPFSSLIDVACFNKTKKSYMHCSFNQ